ncbi:NAD(P)-dependent oxidoreductase [Belnapia sp. T18]|uniref:NAD(P)-dependent oxidoreductase n=1 Tax=Belnapia arida TaxID=2804533 RepID=A0ABS1UB40_9PROT|nr:NAD(P)-dependent oxidoreductase [Belnapia arida]
MVNCAYDPRLKSQPYDAAYDVDLPLAASAAAAAAPYVMLSSRVVYGMTGRDGRLAEDMPLAPTSHYGRAKRETEARLRAIPGLALTILRLANIIDPLDAEGERVSFFGLALRGLRCEGRITFDMSPFVERDFLPAEILAERLVMVAADPRPGQFNMGSGVALPCGRIAEWLIEGYGGGTLLVSNCRDYDGFCLDMTAAARTWRFRPLGPAELRRHCVAAGRLLRQEG